VEKFERELLGLLPRLRRFARSLTRNAAQADDLCQMALEKALMRRSQRREEARLDAWMFMIMRNCWIDERRKNTRELARFDAGVSADGLSDTAAPTNDPLGTLHLHQAMNALPDEQREAAALVWVEGFSYQEAADRLEIPIGTITSRLSRARGRLIKNLDGEND
jgi:RNA polymerase sigma-70 factor (ECF subfamily)